MKPHAVLAASIIISKLDVELRCDLSDGPTHGKQYYIIRGRGMLAPGVVIPNEWWDRPRIIERLEVSAAPQTSPDDPRFVRFWGRCYHVATFRAIYNSNVREDLEREIVPAALMGLDRALWPDHKCQYLPPVTAPFGTPVDHDDIESLRARVSVKPAPTTPVESEPMIPASRKQRVRVIDI